MALHLNDNDGKGDQHLMPFDGNINWDTVMKKITDIQYKGATTLEIMNMGYEYIKEPREYLAIVFERAKKLRDLR